MDYESHAKLAKEHKKIVPFLKRIKKTLNTVDNDVEDRRIAKSLGKEIEDQEGELKKYIAGMKECVDALINGVSIETVLERFDRGYEDGDNGGFSGVGTAGYSEPNTQKGAVPDYTKANSYPYLCPYCNSAVELSAQPTCTKCYRRWT